MNKDNEEMLRWIAKTIDTNYFWHLVKEADPNNSANLSEEEMQNALAWLIGGVFLKCIYDFEETMEYKISESMLEEIIRSIMDKNNDN